MTFKQATDALLGSVTLQDLAVALKASVQAIRQARVAEGMKAHRSPPEGWELAVAKLARKRASQLNHLAMALEALGAKRRPANQNG